MASSIPRVDASPISRSNIEWIYRLLLGLIAGGAALALISLANPLFTVPKEYHIQGLGESNERWLALQQQQSLADQKNAALFIGMLGALLAIAIAVRSNSHWSWMKRLAICVPVGLVAGAVAGIVSSLLQTYFSAQGAIELPQSTAIYATMFGLLGAGIGAGIGFTSSIPFNQKVLVERILIGLVSGAVAGAAYPVVGSLIIPSANIEALLPQNLASLAICLGLSCGILGVTLPVSHDVSAQSSAPEKTSAPV